MRLMMLVSALFLLFSAQADVFSDFLDGDCVNFNELRQVINSDMEPVDDVFYIKGTFSDPQLGEGNIGLNLFEDRTCTDNNAGYFNRSWNGEKLHCSSGGVSQCYRKRGLYTYMTELVLETLRHHEFKLFCIGSFADTNRKMFDSVDGTEEDRILGTAIGRTVISYFGRDAIMRAEHMSGKGYCIELRPGAWN